MKPSGHTEDSRFEVGDRVVVESTRFDYRDERIIGATGTVTSGTHDRNDGWFYRVRLDDEDLLKWAVTYGPGETNPAIFHEWELGEANE